MPLQRLPEPGDRLFLETLGLFHQSRLLAGRVTLIPSREAFRREFTEMVFRELGKLGGDVETLTGALTAWVADGFPLGSKLRSSGACKILRRLGVPPLFRVELRASWGKSYIQVGSTNRGELTDNHPFLGGTVSWRLPWKSHMEVYAGVREAPPRNSKRKLPDNEAYVLSLKTWPADHEGTRVLSKETIATPPRRKIRRFRQQGGRHYPDIYGYRGVYI